MHLIAQEHSPYSVEHTHKKSGPHTRTQWAQQKLTDRNNLAGQAQQQRTFIIPAATSNFFSLFCSIINFISCTFLNWPVCARGTFLFNILYVLALFHLSGFGHHFPNALHFNTKILFRIDESMKITKCGFAAYIHRKKKKHWWWCY